MTSTQRRSIEWPLFVLLVWIVQSLELGILQLPWEMGSIHVFPIVIAFVAMTQKLNNVFFLALLFAYMGSASIGYPAPIYLAVNVWVALLTRSVVSAFTLEGRQHFLLLVGVGYLVRRFSTWVLLSVYAESMPLSYSILRVIGNGIGVCAIAWFLFPLCMFWMEFFDHSLEESQELGVGIKA